MQKIEYKWLNPQCCKDSQGDFRSKYKTCYFRFRSWDDEYVLISSLLSCGDEAIITVAKIVISLCLKIHCLIMLPSHWCMNVNTLVSLMSHHPPDV